jgi:hypothetical protein
LAVGEVQNETVIDLYCPVCGLSHERAKFISHDALAAAERVAVNLARQAINDMMKEFERSLRGSKHIKFKRGRPLQAEPEKVLIEDSNFELVRTRCCHKHAKVRLLDKILGVYCPYCGLVNSWNIG